MQKKRRLDEVCCEIAPEYSRKVIQSFILAGKVFVNDVKITKAGQQVTVIPIMHYSGTKSRLYCM
jgi:23S rRNA (cytidine1920-2'-O)/16S rRNA (cytidine1409-2'-O)-methyltransferase